MDIEKSLVGGGGWDGGLGESVRIMSVTLLTNLGFQNSENTMLSTNAANLPFALAAGSCWLTFKPSGVTLIYPDDLTTK